MRFFGSLEFKGGDILRWVKREADGSGEIVFEVGGRESCLNFSPDAWATLAAAVVTLQAGGREAKECPGARIAESPEFRDHAKGGIGLNYVSINAYEEPLFFRASETQIVDCDDKPRMLPIFVSAKADTFDGIEIDLNEKAATELRDRLNAALEVHRGVKALLRPKMVPGASPSPRV